MDSIDALVSTCKSLYDHRIVEQRTQMNEMRHFILTFFDPQKEYPNSPLSSSTGFSKLMFLITYSHIFGFDFIKKYLRTYE